MKRRKFVQSLAAMSGIAAWSPAQSSALRRRVRPGDARWPSASEWTALSAELDGQLQAGQSPLTLCASQGERNCTELFSAMKNPYFTRDQADLTHTLGWHGAWNAQASAYVAACRNSADVAAAVTFARKHNLRLVVKGGGHSYQGTSNAPDSLLVWTRPMDSIEMHDAFVPKGAPAVAAVPAVSLGAGAIWMHTYHHVVHGAGRYVQGGGCATVGVAGLIQSGGFGSFSRRYGTAAASLLEAEVVTADGKTRVVSAFSEPELFWALKGGGGGSFGVVTRITLQTHALPPTMGAVRAVIRAADANAYRQLIGMAMELYATRMRDENWGEQLIFGPDNTLTVGMVFSGLSEDQARSVWAPFFSEVERRGRLFSYGASPQYITVAPRKLWSPAIADELPGLAKRDSRPDARAENIYWSENEGEAGQYLYGYQSSWLPASLLDADRRDKLVHTLFEASRHAQYSLHLNKGLADGSPAARRATRETATNPLVLDAFALAICAKGQDAAHVSVPNARPDLERARVAARAVDSAMRVLRNAVPVHGSYVSESDYFEAGWQKSFWGGNYNRLLAIKNKYDPEGLFYVRHGVGSEQWSDDGFTRLA